VEQAAARPPSLKESLEEYGRGLGGGLLFSLPLLYTMEMWWTGFIATPEKLLVALLVCFLLLIGYNLFAGLHPDASFGEVLFDSVEELGLGMIIAAVVLALAGQLAFGEGVLEGLGKVVVEGIACAIGVSVGTAQLGGELEQQKEQGGRDYGMWGEFVLAVCGASLIAANVAPTEEIQMIAVESTPLRLLGIWGLSALIAATVLHYSAFKGSRPYVKDGVLPPVLFGIFATIAVALITSLGMLWFFGRLEGGSFLDSVAQCVVLGLPATLGASAGRLLLGS
jgi:putative integral membrane protein (TIGR02587 family)